MELTDEQTRILRHMLGIDLPDVRNPKPYRDYYCAARGDKKLTELEQLGAVRLYQKTEQYDWYTTTDTGREAAFASHKRIMVPKSKRMYARYLDASDAMADLTFREFLTSPYFADVRAAV